MRSVIDKDKIPNSLPNPILDVSAYSTYSNNDIPMSNLKEHLRTPLLGEITFTKQEVVEKIVTKVVEELTYEENEEPYELTKK